MVEKKPQFKAWVTDSCVHTLTPCFAKSLYEIGDVRTCTAMVDVYEKPSFVVFRVLDCQESFEYMLW